jgi:hypothetical protein
LEAASSLILSSSYNFFKVLVCFLAVSFNVWSNFSESWISFSCFDLSLAQVDAAKDLAFFKALLAARSGSKRRPDPTIGSAAAHSLYFSISGALLLDN